MLSPRLTDTQKRIAEAEKFIYQHFCCSKHPQRTNPITLKRAASNARLVQNMDSVKEFCRRSKRISALGPNMYTNATSRAQLHVRKTSDYQLKSKTHILRGHLATPVQLFFASTPARQHASVSFVMYFVTHENPPMPHVSLADSSNDIHTTKKELRIRNTQKNER